MDEERFAWALEDEQSIVRDHNQRITDAQEPTFAESLERLARALNHRTDELLRPHLEGEAND